MAKQIRFDNQVVIVTGGGGGLGRAYGLFFASRGASVLVNDLSRDNADKVVSEIKAAGGKAVANYESSTAGDKVVAQAVKEFGKVDILINNAGILRDKSFKSMTEQEWDIVQEVHVKSAYACSKAVWPLFRKQQSGKIINITSAAGIYGAFGQANYSAAKMGMISFSKTLAREGQKHNIHVNAVAPIAASAMTETIMPPEVLANLSPDMIVPLVAFLVSSSCDISGKVLEAGAGWYGLLRWERTKGVVFKTDGSFTPEAVKEKWNEINDFDDADHPENITDADYLGYLEKAKSLPPNPQSSSPVRFDGKTVLITGAGAGLGRSHAVVFAKGGANVVVNDMNKENAEKVVAEIKQAGGKAVAVVASTLAGEKLVKAALDAFGSLHVLVLNAGILRDKSFAAMTEAEWDAVYSTHLKGTYAVAKAAWPVLQKGQYGRIITTASSVGVHGNFGQANYSTAKGAIIGLTRTLAIEGKKYGILANTLVPNAGTSMTSTVWPEEMVRAFSPDFVSPVVGYLGSEDCGETMGLFEVSGGWASSLRWQRTAGYAFPVNHKVTPEDIVRKWDTITRFDDNSTNPNSTAESLEAILGNFGNEEEGGESSGVDYTDPEDSELVAQAKKEPAATGEYTFDERDIALYNLGIGATEKDLDLIYEGDEAFGPVPTFGVIPQFAVSSGVSLDFLPNFSPMQLLHGEQYLSLKAPLPVSGTLVSESKLAEVLDKGKAAAVTTVTVTKDAATGEVICENHSTVFIRGSGGFGGKKTGGDRGAATALNKPPARKPDHIVEEKTLPQLACIYRLSGDYNPLHVDPNFAKVGGFDQPILHGLCSFGISGKHIFRKYGAFKDIKVRFAGVLMPGETLETSMWKEGDKVIFVTKCKERGTTVLSSAAVTLA